MTNKEIVRDLAKILSDRRKAELVFMYLLEKEIVKP